MLKKINIKILLLLFFCFLILISKSEAKSSIDISNRYCIYYEKKDIPEEEIVGKFPIIIYAGDGFKKRIVIF